MQNFLLKSLILTATLVATSPVVAAKNEPKAPKEVVTSGPKSDRGAENISSTGAENRNYDFGNNGKHGDGNNGNNGNGAVIGSGDGTPSNALPGPEMHFAGPALLALAGVMLMLRRRNLKASHT